MLFQPIGSVRRALNIIRDGKFVRAPSAAEAEPLKELKRGAFRYRGNRKNPAFENELRRIVRLVQRKRHTIGDTRSLNRGI